MTKAEAALLYASWGWHVLPVVPGGKAPASQHGVKDATTDREQIARWWAQNPDFNIGIATGERSGIVVFDVDPRNGGDDSWRQWQSEHGRVPDGPMQMTAGGGEHHVAAYNSEIRSCKLCDGVDLLADGRYFLVWPSTIDGRRYEWEASSDPFDGVPPFAVPEKWMQAYRGLRKPDAGPSTAPGTLIQGNRNSGLTAIAGVMRRYGMTEAEILAALSVANETRCEIPLPSSEVVRIAKSVCRYEPEADVAASASAGYEAAEALLSAAKAEASHEYYFTRATAFLGQPAPLQWVIRGWMPADGVSMVYGESGAGKTFVTLDMACHIAAGLPWHGIKAKSGAVVYMAGEGNYGLRQRIAAWCKAHGIDRLDNLLVSSRGLDLDSPAAAAQVIGAVREVTADDVAVIFIDTLNNHMSGDENSARDTRNMLNSCNIVARALRAAVCLNHHTGHAVDAKSRARGSSAWKASLDSAILVTKKSSGDIELTCTKMKDAEPPRPICGRLQPVALGCTDDDGAEIFGAVFDVTTDTDHQAQPQREPEIQADIKKFTNAWLYAGAEEREQMPYLSRSAFIDYLVAKEGLSEATARTYAKGSRRGRPIYNLLNAQIIEAYQHGWVVSESTTASAMLVLRAGVEKSC